MPVRWSISALAFLLTITTTAATAAATTWMVPGDGSNTCTVGSPNCNTIAQAVAASANGDTVQIAAGTFAAPNVALNKTLTIAGAGIASTFVQPGAGATGFSIGADGIVLQDLTMQNGATGVAFPSARNNTQLVRVAFSGQTVRGVEISATGAVTNVQVVDCSIATAGVIGLRMASTSQVTDLTITGTTFSGNQYGIYQANDGNTSTLTNLTVSGCTFTNNTIYGIYAEEMRNSTIESSSFTGGAVAIGILKFYGSNGVPISNLAIRDNQFSGFAGNALDFEIFALGLGTPGVTIENNTVTKNVAISTSAASLFVRLHPTLANGPVDFVDNTITATGTFGAGTAVHGVRLRGNGPVTFTGNVIDGGNVGGSGTTPPSSGIYIESQSSSANMPATAVITGTCNRIENFHVGVSVFNSVAGTYGGLPAGATVSFENDAIVGNDAAGAANGASPTLDFENDWWGCAAGPGNPGCDATLGAVDSSPSAPAPPACVPCVTNADCDDTLFCDGVETCNGSQQCVPGTDPCAGGDVCGNACNESADDCLVANGVPCRPSAGPCDVAESCDGVSPSCPADAFASSSTVCRAAGGDCDLAESCTGSGAACPADAKRSAGESCRNAAGECDVAESCDGAGNGCPADGFAPSSTVCRAATGSCDVAESCTGSSATCPADAAQPDGTICNDGMSCTVGDVCTAGVCGGNSMTCGDGTIQGACGELCDDGNVVSGDGCSATCQPEFVCTPLPLPGCRTGESAKSQLQVKDKTPDTKDQLQWKWNRGAITTKADYGTPTTSTDYRLCMYDNGVLVSRAFMPAGQLCAGKPCWKETKTGFVYKDKEATPDGITGLNLKQGLVAGKAKIGLKGKGANLDIPTLPFTQPVTVQLRNSNGVCWETVHSAPASKNDATQFKDKND